MKYLMPLVAVFSVFGFAPSTAYSATFQSHAEGGTCLPESHFFRTHPQFENKPVECDFVTRNDSSMDKITSFTFFKSGHSEIPAMTITGTFTTEKQFRILQFQSGSHYAIENVKSGACEIEKTPAGQDLMKCFAYLDTGIGYRFIMINFQYR